MMAFQSGFVVSVLRDGKTIREQNNDGERTVRIPFGSEYSIRIWNKTSYRAYARVLIDGTEVVSGKLVLSAGEKVDLERFVLDGDLNRGKRFKFVEAGNSEVQDPTAKENGEIEVIFEPETQPALTLSGASWSASAGGVLRSRGFAGSSVDGAIGATYAINSAAQGSTTTTNHAYVNASDKGATIEGGQSNQQFQNVNTFFLTDPPVSIKIRLRGPKIEQTKVESSQGQSAAAWGVHFENGKPLIRAHGRDIGTAESVEITATHLVIRVPMKDVQVGWHK